MSFTFYIHTNMMCLYKIKPSARCLHVFVYLLEVEIDLCNYTANHKIPTLILIFSH